jgi:putative ATP-dependent endonuclease of OLD family
LKKPHLIVQFRKGLNVLIGENDTGKSAIIDAIRLTLGTHSAEWTRIVDEDFFRDSARLRIELVFVSLTDEEAKHLIEWLSIEGKTPDFHVTLRINFDVKRTENRILPSDVKAGADDEGHPLTVEAREYLRTTYLRPLRDARNELVPRKNSRLSQILLGHELFKGKHKDHELKKLHDRFTADVEAYFETVAVGGVSAPVTGEKLKKEIDRYLAAFYGEERKSVINAAEASLKAILEKLEIAFKETINPGLGTLNRLFMASELVHLNKTGWHGLRLCLIEELEAHLHPQAQMQVIEALQRETEIQFILTTHSPNLASKVRLDSLIIQRKYVGTPKKSQIRIRQDHGRRLRPPRLPGKAPFRRDPGHPDRRLFRRQSDRRGRPGNSVGPSVPDQPRRDEDAHDRRSRPHLHVPGSHGVLPVAGQGVRASVGPCRRALGQILGRSKIPGRLFAAGRREWGVGVF